MLAARGARAAGVALLSLMVILSTTATWAFQTPQDEFVPATQLGEQLPATPLVFIAYAFCWVALLAYVFMLWRRLGRVQRDLAEAGARLKSRP